MSVATEMVLASEAATADAVSTAKSATAEAAAAASTADLNQIRAICSSLEPGRIEGSCLCDGREACKSDDGGCCDRDDWA